MKRPEVRSLMSKITRHLVPDTKSYAGTVGYTDVEIKTKRGSFKRRVQQEETRYAWIVTDEEHNEKFTKCATSIIGAERAKKLLGLARDCVNLPDIGEVSRAAAAA